MLNNIDRLDLFLRIILYAIFVVALLSGVNILLGGVSSVPGATNSVDISVDNELRFFSVFWLAYGICCFMIARNLERYRNFILFIAAIFFLGGVARFLSILLVGMPSSILIPAMILEFILPLFLYALHRQSRKLLSKQCS